MLIHAANATTRRRRYRPIEGENSKRQQLTQRLNVDMTPPQRRQVCMCVWRLSECECVCVMMS